METIRENFSFTPNYLTKNSQPWFPVMGEIHYSRYPEKYWSEAISKMKAGGVDVISTYVFWLHHEEIEGEYDFTGSRNLREFIKRVKENGMLMFLRIGPWCHGEARNGGFPDWLLKKPFKVRANNEEYFECVKKYYARVFKEAEGLFYKDGGPIIGVQIDNELAHCGGPRGEEGEVHMRRLTQIAKEIGYDVPYFTATGWGGAATGGLLPVMGGYCEAPWDQRITEIEPSGNYIFTLERNDHNIGSDHGFGAGITYPLDKFPYLTAELGGGLQVTHHRRPVAHGSDIGAMSMVKMGSGVNLLGYYMYHGGTNPKGKLTTLQESRATGYANDLPVWSYDFSGPIREFGRISNTFREIKLLAMFLKDFGTELCSMKPDIPSSNPLKQTNFSDLRTSVRHNGKSGYLFVNNYQRRYEMSEHLAEQITVKVGAEEIAFPKFDVHNRDFFFCPFNMPVGNAVIKKASAVPLCKVSNGKDYYVFYPAGSNEPQFDIEGELGNAELLVINRSEAMNAYKIVYKGKEYLVVTDGVVTETDGKYRLASNGSDIKVYPEFDTTPECFEKIGVDGKAGIYRQRIAKAEASCKLVKETDDVYTLEISYEGDMADCFINVDLGCDTADLIIAGETIGDWFYTGETWRIGLKRFDFPKEIKIKLYELKEGAQCFLEKWPEMKDGRACEIYKAEAEAEYEVFF